MDQVAAHASLDVALEDGCPSAIKTPFGWAVVSRIPTSLVTGPTSKADVNLQSISEEITLSTLAERFHSTESFGVDLTAPKTISFEDAQALEVLQRSIKSTCPSFRQTSTHQTIATKPCHGSTAWNVAH